MRAVIYARYSSENQRDASIEDQVRLCRERIEREGWRLVSTYTDRAMSGASALRPGYQKLMEDARGGAFDIVVAEALDRLSRDQEDIAALYKRLGFAGVAIVTLAEGEISDLHVGLKGTMNALFLKDLAIKTHRGLRGRVEMGKSGGGLCYGYDVERAVDAMGEPIHGERRVNDAEAEIVQRIFRDFAAGLSPKRIAVTLNKEGVPGPRRAAWGPSTIYGNAKRGTGIVNNELYVGRLVWNRLRYIKDPETGKRVSRLNPEEQWIFHEVPELRIVDQELWERVKARQATLDRRPGARSPESAGNSESRPFWDRRRPRYLFSGLMRCGLCGGGYSKISANLFGCSTARNKGTCSNRVNVRRDALETTVLNALRNRLMDPDLFAGFVADVTAAANAARMSEGAEMQAQKGELARIERRLKAIVDAIAEGMPARSLMNELLSLEARQDELTQLIARAHAPKPLIHPGLAQAYRRRVAELHEALTHDADDPALVEEVRSLVDRIVLTPEGKQLRIDLKGDIEGIFEISAIAAKQKPAAISRGGLEQLKLVAGAGNHREFSWKINV
jgi:DNA invertase Pin-like site-specific DNA recombinase